LSGFNENQTIAKCNNNSDITRGKWLQDGYGYGEGKPMHPTMAFHRGLHVCFG